MSNAQLFIKNLMESNDAEAFEAIGQTLSEMARAELSNELSTVAESYGMRKKIVESEDMDDDEDEYEDEEDKEDEDEKDELTESTRLLKASKLSSAEYQKVKKLKDFEAKDWKWDGDQQLYVKVKE